MFMVSLIFIGLQIKKGRSLSFRGGVFYSRKKLIPNKPVIPWGDYPRSSPEYSDDKIPNL